MLSRLLKTICPAKRLCPLLSLALIFGCGKKINDPATTSSTPNVQAQNPPNLIIMELNDALSAITQYTFQKTGWFLIPEKLVVKAGDATGRRVRVSFNFKSDGDYSSYCDYKSTTEAYELPLEVCKSKAGGTLGTIPSSIGQIITDKGNKIKIESLSPIDDDVIDAVFLVDWI